VTKPRRPRRGTSFLIHARPGSGKSTLLLSLPKPALIVDAEAGDFDGLATIEGLADVDVRSWEEYEDDPTILTPNTVVIIDCEEYSDYQLGLREIREDRDRKWKGFGLDTITRIQAKMEEELEPLERKMLRARRGGYDHYKAMLDYMRADLEWLHEQTIRRGLVTAWACQTNEEMVPLHPRLVGQLRQSIPDIPDIVGFLRVEEGTDEEGHHVRWRELDIASAEGALATAKCRRRHVANHYGDTVPNPNLAQIAAVASPRKINTRKEDING